MNTLLIAIAALIAIALSAQIAPKVGVASPLILLALGIGIGFLPWVDPIQLDPQLVLDVILPPLLFGAAVAMPVMDFRRELKAVAGLAVGLVLLTAIVLGLVVHWLVPAISLPWAIALGAVLSPTDAVAVSIAKRQGVSSRIITVLEGEGLFNDATALVLLSAAITAAAQADADALKPWALGADFAVSLTVALAVGWAVGEGGVRIRARMTQPAADTVLSFSMPFLASVPAEHLGGSGLVAAVVAGLVVSYRRSDLMPALNRRFAQQNWHTLELVLEGVVFLIVGIQAYGIVVAVDADEAGLGVRGTVLIAVLLGALTVLLRAAFVGPFLVGLHYHGAHSKARLEGLEVELNALEARLAHAGDIDDELLTARNLDREKWDEAVAKWHRRLDQGWKRTRRKGGDLAYFTREPLGVREGAIIVWAGMRGAVTLAAAQTLPWTAPARPVLLLIALLVAAGSLTIQGLTLPLTIRLVKPRMVEDIADTEECDQLVGIMKSTLKESALTEALRSAGPGAVAGTRVLSLSGISTWRAPAGATAPVSLGSGQASEAPVELTRERLRDLAIEAIREQRRALLEARDEGVYSSRTLEYALERLDQEEILLGLAR